MLKVALYFMEFFLLVSAIVRVFMKNGDGGDYYYQEGQFNAFDVGAV